MGPLHSGVVVVVLSGGLCKIQLGKSLFTSMENGNSGNGSSSLFFSDIVYFVVRKTFKSSPPLVSGPVLSRTGEAVVGSRLMSVALCARSCSVFQSKTAVCTVPCAVFFPYISICYINPSLAPSGPLAPIVVLIAAGFCCCCGGRDVNLCRPAVVPCR